MISIKFEIPNNYDIILYKIFEDLDLSNSIIKICDEEVINENNDDFFEKTLYSFSEFQKKILETKCYPIFLNLQVYDLKYDSIDIENYDDFLKSNCQLILFITDNTFVEIYSKNIKALESIKKNAIKNNFSNLQCIYNIDDVRKKFTAYY